MSLNLPPKTQISGRGTRNIRQIVYNLPYCLICMHISFDLYPSYLRDFSTLACPTSGYKLCYDIHAMRNYAYRNEGGKRLGPFPQVRKEGSLEITCHAPKANHSLRSLDVTHTRSWATWTNQKPASKQTIEASIKYAANTVGSPGNWSLTYQSEPILPVKSYRYNPLGPMEQSGKRSGNQITLRTGTRSTVRRYSANHDFTCLYTLVERLQAGAVQPGPVDYLDDLSMFRPGLEITSLAEQTLEIDKRRQTLHGFVLVGPAILPIYFWQNKNNHVLAIIGRNVAYTLTAIEF